MGTEELKREIIKKIIRYMVMYHDSQNDAVKRLEFINRIDTAFHILALIVRECRINDDFKSLTVDETTYSYEVTSERPFRYEMTETNG